jgi:hypothetical protein
MTNKQLIRWLRVNRDRELNVARTVSGASEGAEIYESIAATLEAQDTEINNLRAALDSLIDNVQTGSYESTGQCVDECKKLLDVGRRWSK